MEVGLEGKKEPGAPEASGIPQQEAGGGGTQSVNELRIGPVGTFDTLF